MPSQDTSRFVNIYRAFPEGHEAMRALERAVKSGPIDATVRELVKVRASQINGCAYCIDMHYKDARAGGETEERLYMLPAWREATVYTDAERAALALTEAVTAIADGGVPADVEAEARSQFDERSYAALVFTITVINAWNRLAITSHSPAGRYRPKVEGQATAVQSSGS
jgi:AhpD family alkylhydroperoxidase